MGLIHKFIQGGLKALRVDFAAALPALSIDESKASTPARDNETDSKVLAFKSTDAAFWYICKYMNTAPQRGHALPGIVIDTASGVVSVKLPNDAGGFINPHLMTVRPTVPSLKAGDFVLVGIDKVNPIGIEGTVIALRV